MEWILKTMQARFCNQLGKPPSTRGGDFQKNAEGLGWQSRTG